MINLESTTALREPEVGCDIGIDESLKQIWTDLRMSISVSATGACVISTFMAASFAGLTLEFKPTPKRLRLE
jgi:hypothetical protein